MKLLEKYSITQIVQRTVEVEESFLCLARRYANRLGTTVLCSGGDFDSSRSHYLAFDPWLICRGKKKGITLTVQGETEDTCGCPWGLLDQIQRAFSPAFSAEDTAIATGLFGYLSYELKDFTEKLCRTTIDDLHLPLLYFTSPLFVLEQRVGSRVLTISTPCFSSEMKCDAERRVDTLLEQWKEPQREVSPFCATESARSCFTKQQYLNSVEKVRKYIFEGDIYQANVSQRFSCAFTGDPFELFERLFENNPAPFFAYLHCGDHHIVSSSPERFIAQRGMTLESRPIKGTLPRGRDREEDRENRDALLESEKNGAELSMIVDLVRNDLGKISQVGSVEVSKHKQLESYSNVHHLVSCITSKKAPDVSSVDVLQALFPGGSITGCPKIRAMEIIDEIEPVVRHVYTGAIGYISFHDTMDFSIAIRTAITKNKRLFLGVGGGIVFDSDAEEEYNESLEKGKTFFELFTSKGCAMNEPTVWSDGMFIPESEATLPLSSLGAQYGAGLFETVRCDSGRLLFLNAHVERFNESWQELFSRSLPDVDWRMILSELVERNKLRSDVAAIKFGAYVNTPTPHVYAQARSFHRTSHLQGLSLKVFPHSRENYLARYKTNNYLFSHLASQWVTEEGADHAVLLNADGSISETHCANLLFLRENEVISPSSSSVLPGVTERQVALLCRQEAIPFSCHKIFPEDLSSFCGVLVTNSLIGVSEAKSFEGQKLTMGSPIGTKLMELYQGNLA